MVVFYPTRYDVDEVVPRIACPVAAFFAEHDVLPGATVGDAQALREKLRDNDNVSRKIPPGGAVPVFKYIFCQGRRRASAVDSVFARLLW